MQLNLKKPREVKGILAVAVMQGQALPFPEVTRSVRKDEFEGKAGQLLAIDTHGKAAFRKLVLYGLGEKKEFKADCLRRFGGAAVRYAAQVKSPSVAVFVLLKPARDTVRLACEGAILANYRPVKFKTKKDDYFEVKELDVVTNEQLGDVLKKAAIMANAQNYVRDINENPANIATPQLLADEARKLAKERKLDVAVFDKGDLKRLKMNAILAVNQGSALPPVFVVLEYNRGRKNLPLYAVVGKGITFDSGGISIKPSKGMQDMKYDKTGAVTAMGIIKAVSELGLPIRLMAAFAATENMPSGSAQKPGDIITAYNGKTIEVLNTDAEGRLILADTLAYVAEAKPRAIIDLATLTGAMIVCLGRNRAGLFTNDDHLAKVIYDSGEKTFERVWRMPLDSEYKEMNKADFGDIKNIGSETGDAGSITAACFLSEFIGDCRWAHIDIAGVDNIASSHGYLEKGASGIGVRLVTEALARLAKR
ncbi:MAG: leucyl aminopeptidase [Candidatus ainarchaeum sp.]|nr:leucyl aminopeptidase [Candidatus ainarchaeum sp.]